MVNVLNNKDDWVFYIRSTLGVFADQVYKGKPSAEQTQYGICLNFNSDNELNGFLFKVILHESNTVFHPSVHCWMYFSWMPFSSVVRSP